MPHKTIRAALAGLALAVGLVGCGHAGTVAEPSAGQTAAGSSVSSKHTGPLVDVSSIWEEYPKPACPRWIHNNDADTDGIPGVDMPSHQSVAAALAGVKSPASEEWVREELGWVTQWLIKVRKRIRDDTTDPVLLGRSETKQFGKYVEHVRQELEEGHDLPDAALDNAYADGCR